MNSPCGSRHSSDLSEPGDLGITLIVWIDDEFAITCDKAIGIIGDLLELNRREECSILLGKLELDEYGDWRQRFREFWDNLDSSARATLLRGLAELLPDGGRDQWFLPDPFGYLCPGMRVEKFPPSEWDQARNLIKKHISENAGLVLCLIDQLLEKDADRTAGEGIQLLKRAINDLPHSEVVCGLISQTFKIDQEFAEGKKLGRREEVPLSRFLPFSKKRLASRELFMEGLRLGVLMVAAARLVAEVTESIVDAAKEAQRTLEDLSVYDFYRTVIRDSHEEGLWEVETLLRLFNVYHCTHARRKVYGKRTELNQWTDRIRKLVRPNGPEAAHAGSLWQHSRVECWEWEPELNLFHLPLELGDIMMDGQGKYYILVGQPCDLAMRKNGRRSSSYATLVEVREEAPNENQGETVVPLEFFGDDGKTRYAYFKYATAVSLDILDLAVFNKNGRCEFVVGQECPSELQGSWQERFKVLKRVYEEKADELNRLRSTLAEIDATDQDALWKYALRAVATPLPATSLAFQDNRFDFGLTRKGRYRQPRVTTLLQRWAAFLSRPAHDRLFGATG